MTDDWRALNLANWEERTAVHLGPGGYDLSAHRAGAGSLGPIIEPEIGEVAGLRVLHLQCHIGHDSVALAQRGAAAVVGLDFSPAATTAAAALAAEVGLTNTRFVTADLYDAITALPDDAAGFDLVFTSWGTIGWLPDLPGWARIVAHFLRPGGRFLFADGHPAALVFDAPADAEARPSWLIPYFERGPHNFDDPTDYADPDARLANSRTVNWMHPLAAILDALRAAGLRLDRLAEDPRVTWRMFPGLVQDADGLWTWSQRNWLPLSLIIHAKRA